MKIHLFVITIALVSSLLGGTEEISMAISAPDMKTELEVLVIDREEKKGTLNEGEVGIRFRFDAKNRTETLKLGFICDPNSEVGDVYDCWSDNQKIAAFIYPCRSVGQKECENRLFVVDVTSGKPKLISLPPLDGFLKEFTKAKAPLNIAKSSIDGFHHHPFGWVSDKFFIVGFSGSCMLQSDIENKDLSGESREMRGCVIYRLEQNGQFVVQRIINLSIQG